MARSLEALVRFTIKEDGTVKSAPEAESEIVSLTRLHHDILELQTNTQNYQVVFGSAFTTPTHLFLGEENGRSFTYSIGANNRHHMVEANGFACLKGSITSLFLSVSGSPVTRPKIEIVLCR